MTSYRDSPCGQTNTCENITLFQTSFAGCNYSVISRVSFLSAIFFSEGTAVAYNYNTDQGAVTGGNYDSTTGILTIMDDVGYNPRGEVELGTETVGALAGPISAGVAVDLFYQG